MSLSLPNIIRQKTLVMGGIKDIMGFVFWVDNSKVDHLQASLDNQKRLPKEKAIILREIAKDKKNNKVPIGKTKVNISANR